MWNDQRKASICANLSSAEASIVTPRGMLSGAWDCGVLGGVCDQAGEKGAVKLSCASGTIDSIVFASFGTPVGSCQAGFTTSSCNSNNSMAVVSKACLGKASCEVTASTTDFGGDPCFDVVKTLAVTGTCSSHAVRNVFNYAVTVPVGSTAVVFLPTMDTAAPTITEGHTNATVWDGGKYVPGVSGVTAGVQSGSEIQLSVGSGTFFFQVVG